VNAKEMERITHSEINILKIIFPDKNERSSVIRDVQRDPVTDLLVHLDLMGIKLTEKIKLLIPVVLAGTPAGVREGGILEHILREVEVEGLPLEIPDHIEIDVSSLNIGDVVTLEQAEVEKIRIVTEIHHAVAHVVQPKVAAETETDLGEIEGDESEAVSAGESGSEE
jgi:large subunit ribosomal protein L25